MFASDEAGSFPRAFCLGLSFGRTGAPVVLPAETELGMPEAESRNRLQGGSQAQGYRDVSF